MFLVCESVVIISKVPSSYKVKLRSRAVEPQLKFQAPAPGIQIFGSELRSIDDSHAQTTAVNQ